MQNLEMGPFHRGEIAARLTGAFGGIAPSVASTFGNDCGHKRNDKCASSRISL